MKAQFEHISPPNGYSIHAFEYRDKAFDAPWHIHPENELTYIGSSKGLRYVGNQVNTFEAGDFVLLKGNVPHCWINPDNHVDIAHSIVIQWNDSLFPDLPEFQAITELLARSSRGILFDASLFTGLEQRLLTIVHSDPLSRYILLLDLLKELSRSPAQRICELSFADEFNTQTNQRIEKIIGYVKSHYHQPITLLEVSTLCNMREESFSRFFSQTMKKAFFTYLTEYRLTMACKLLIDSSMSVSEIAYSCGFGSLAFFHRKFKQYHQSSPSQYKKMFLLNTARLK
ncbi:MAG: helix-turn-helix domain-containing protein [Chitinophaga sp.]|uniref:AraC family transcriptional regulator n=1 Tax=Chitinophaga sp. TaxID=1869181 RepID=UPI001B1708E8|nr:AraC family transcriptional regulator [Chitinophaga sp.]MBO9732413.1 helix-turn-helix domain-containing protein [Chitinophaga sp.]